MIPILAATVAPALLLLAVTYALRPQGGARWLRPNPVPAGRLIAALAAEHAARPRPTDWRSPLWTVRTEVQA